MPFLCFLLFVLAGFITGSATAQTIPAPDAALNYTQIMFEYPALPGANQYLIQITEDTTGSNFSHPFIEQKDSSTATLISGFGFGKKYKWQYTGYTKGIRPDWKGPYRFQILADSFVYNHHYRVRILNNELEEPVGLVSADLLRMFMNRHAQPVWHLPNIDEFTSIRDLRLTAAGTVTYITDRNLFVEAYETDLQGNILWQAPNNGKISGDSTEYYHHNFTRLPNGNYMVLSKKFVWKPVPAAFRQYITGTRFETYTGNDTLYARIEFGTIIEYNPQKQVVWAWNSEDYLNNTDIFAIKDEPSTAPVKKNEALNGHVRTKRGKIEAHLNAFSVDTDNQFVYAGFRNLSRVIKIDKKTAEVVYSWGAKTSEEAKDGNNFFNTQHDANILSNGCIAVFNNNEEGVGTNVPSVVVFNQPLPGNTSQIVWQHPCNFDTLTPNKSLRGGNIDQLPNLNFLVSMGNANKIAEITPDHRIVWSAVIEREANPHEQMLVFLLYRAYYASSLYPCYFTVQSNSATLSQSGLLQLKIFNEGTEDDSYTVTVSSASGSFKKNHTASVAKAKSAVIEIKPDAALPAGEKIELTVTSNTNPALQRKLWIAYK